MDFFKNLAKGAQDLFSSFFKKQEVISPIASGYENRPASFFTPTPEVQRGMFPQPSNSQSTDTGEPQQPPYAPNVVNQTVSFGGAVWKGNPGTGWTLDHMEGGGGGGGGGESFADSILQAVVDPLQKEIESWWKRLDEYDKNNPFAFDEALARASSQERLNPYFDATLNEFMTGVRRSSARSVEDMTRTIGELNVDASKLSDNERLSTQEAIRSSEEGFAGAGLFFSGRRERATGMEEVRGGQVQEDIQTKLGRGITSSRLSNQRLQEDIALQEARQKRLIGAERTTALETDIAKQKRENELQRGLERLQFAGKIPGASPVNQLQLENQFMSGLV